MTREDEELIALALAAGLGELIVEPGAEPEPRPYLTLRPIKASGTLRNPLGEIRSLEVALDPVRHGWYANAVPELTEREEAEILAATEELPERLPCTRRTAHELLRLVARAIVSAPPEPKKGTADEE